MLEQVRKAVENGRQKKVEELVRGALEAGAGPGEILDAMEQAMGAVGERFQSGELFIPEVLVAAKTLQKGVEVLRPLLARGDTGKYGKFITALPEGTCTILARTWWPSWRSPPGLRSWTWGWTCRLEQVCGGGTGPIRIAGWWASAPF